METKEFDFPNYRVFVMVAHQQSVFIAVHKQPEGSEVIACHGSLWATTMKNAEKEITGKYGH